jgi:hypothetical protein
MEPALVAQALGLSGLVLASLLDLRAQERRAATRRAKAKSAGPARRCPFCHKGFEEGEPSADCRGCGAPHHAACWAESPRCCIYGCGAPGPVGLANAPEADEDPAPAEDLPQDEVPQPSPRG